VGLFGFGPTMFGSAKRITPEQKGQADRKKAFAKVISKVEKQDETGIAKRGTASAFSRQRHRQECTL